MSDALIKKLRAQTEIDDDGADITHAIRDDFMKAKMAWEEFKKQQKAKKEKELLDL